MIFEYRYTFLLSYTTDAQISLNYYFVQAVYQANLLTFHLIIKFIWITFFPLKQKQMSKM